MEKQDTIRIPKRYYIDHVECDCEAPVIVRETKHHYYIDATENDAMAEFRSRALEYADDIGGDYSRNGYGGLVLSARATLSAIGEDVELSRQMEAAYVSAAPSVS